MRVVDTSAWIDWLIEGAAHKTLLKVFPEKSQCVVPTIVRLELAKWLFREVDEDAADQAIAYTQKCMVAPLDTRIALAAADLHRQYKLATADAIVYATALEHEADLLTCDAHFEELPGVILICKPASRRGVADSGRPSHRMNPLRLTAARRINLGKRAGVASGLLGILCILAELCFLLPDLLVTRDALPMYAANTRLFRGVLEAAIVATFVLGFYSTLRLRSKLHGLSGIALGSIALLMGGAEARAIDVGPRSFAAGLDHFVLELLVLGLVYVIFGTAHQPANWPKNYGTVKFQPPETWVGQLMYPFRRHGEQTPYG